MLRSRKRARHDESTRSLPSRCGGGGSCTIPGFHLYPWGKTPCECFQVEKVVVVGRNRLGGGETSVATVGA